MVSSSPKHMKKPQKETKLYNPKILKYIAGRTDGLSKKNAALQAGYSPSTSRKVAERVERQQEFRNATEAFATALGVSLSAPGKGAFETISEALSDNITQSNDRGARTASIKLALEHLGVKSSEVTNKTLVNIFHSRQEREAWEATHPDFQKDENYVAVTLG